MVCSEYADCFRLSPTILNLSLWRFGCANFPNEEGFTNIPIQCQLPEFSGVFGSGAPFRKSPLSCSLPLRDFAPSREPLASSLRAARSALSHAKAQRREVTSGVVLFFHIAQAVRNRV
jgi:hypothetical protein